MRAVTALSMLALALGPAACRDATSPFDARDRRALAVAEVQRLTFSPEDDRSPTWNAASDTVYYSGFSNDLAPAAAGTLLAIGLEGDGVARLVLMDAQVGLNAQRWLVAPARYGDRVAFVALEELQPFWICEEAEFDHCPTLHESGPRLRSGTVFVRSTVHDGRLNDDPSIPIDMTSTVELAPQSGMPVYRSILHPFQTAFNETRDVPFRPTWSPDGTRVGVSDGLGIRIWDVGSGSVSEVPGTEDGVGPAWSPDGNWIAFTWRERTDSIVEACEFGNWVLLTFFPECFDTRVKHVAQTERIVLVQPDGGARVVLVEGRDPVWTPDGGLIIAHVGTGPLRRYDIASGELHDVSGTHGALEPAVSPDGQWIAFTRSEQPDLPRDVYVGRLE